MLTINSDKHPLMNRFHAPGREMRMIVIVPRAKWDGWLTCRLRSGCAASCALTRPN